MKYLCHNAFTGLDISPEGFLKPCCKFKHEGKEPFHIKDGIQNYQESKWLKDLQQDFIDGKKPDGCKRCWIQEDAGVKSKRQLDYERHKSNFDSIDLRSKEFKNISIAFGNICNLACRICGPGASSRWATLLGKIENKKYPIHKWFQDKKIMQDIILNTKEAFHLDVPGGEPLLVEIKEHYQYLEQLIKNGTAKNISLHYTTNGTTFPKVEHLELWNKFKEVDLQISIDDIEERYEYNRWPAKWPQVYNNLKKYQLLSKNNKQIRLSLSFTVSAFTILYAERFVRWCVKEKLPMPWMGVVDTPYHYRPSVLPNEAKIKINDILQTSNIKRVKKLGEILFLDDKSHYQTFVDKVQQFDQIRKQSFQNTFPELSEMIKF
tara:strand:- start:662 stop:1792 length:1131 start_codon:yes stop_codon:yes gene_type:complete